MNRAEAQQLLKRLREFNSDYSTMLEQADAVYQKAMDGFITQVAGKEGAIDVLTVLPSVAVQANMLKRNLVKDIIEMANSPETEESAIMSLSINVVPLEDTL